MSDSKSRYSAAARFYAKIVSHGSMRDAIRYALSKAREEKYNENWKKHMVDLNEIVKKFTPGAKGKPKGVKFEFKNDKYIIKVDMPSGYLRIYDRKLKKYVKRLTALLNCCIIKLDNVTLKLFKEECI